MITEEMEKTDAILNGGSAIRDLRELSDYYKRVREKSVELCQSLVTEDYVIQTIEDVSPPKWHLGHITWFFEQVILEKYVKNYKPFDKQYYFVFNSYYNSFGDRVIRSYRGTVSRPTVEDVYNYRRYVDRQMQNLFDSVSEKDMPAFAELVELGLNHEQQHQELLLTDIKHNFACNPLHPVYHETKDSPEQVARFGKQEFIDIDGGECEIGADNKGFSYDNERPRHKVYVNNYKLMNRLVTCGEFLEFINNGGYKNVQLWLSDGWDTVNKEDWACPSYWINKDGQWHVWTLSGLKPLNPAEPVSHVSYYEADAYANWAGCRLPTEQEWEIAALKYGGDGNNANLMDSKLFHPIPANGNGKLQQMIGDVWEWTASAYLPFPGYPRYPGPLGEYNGKFMINQMVLRGGSCATACDHIRLSYRNFFQCEKRWQFTGMRLAKDS